MNAISTIGTLEFLDEISKFYTTGIVCQVSDSIFDKADKDHGFIPYDSLRDGMNTAALKSISTQNTKQLPELIIKEDEESPGTGGPVVDYK